MPQVITKHFKWGLLLFILALPTLLLEYFGNGIASKITEFPMINDSSKLLIIRRYGDQFICKKLSKDLTAFDDRIYVVKIGDKPLEITNYHTGDLYVNQFYPKKCPPALVKHVKSTPSILKDSASKQNGAKNK